MRMAGGVILLAAVALTAVAQENGSPHEAVVKEMIAATDQISGVLATIKDASTAADARPPLKKAAEQFVEIRKKAAALKQPDLTEKERLERTYRKKLDNSLLKLREEIVRVRSISGGQEALQELIGLDERKQDDKKDNPK